MLNNVNVIPLGPSAIRSLLQATERKQLVSLRFDDVPDIATAVILGADMSQNELLISDTRPSLIDIFKRMGTNRNCWLQLKTNNDYLRLNVRAMEVRNGLVTLKVMKARSTENRRWHNRVHFQALSGPSVRINREFAPNLSAQLRDLSGKGAVIDIWGKELNRSLCKGQKLNLAMSFNTHFELSLNSTILNSQFVRSPSCHTKLRVYFHELDVLTFHQLEHFVNSTMGVAAA